MANKQIKYITVHPCYGLQCYVAVKKNEALPWPVCSVIRVLAYDRKGPGFDSLSRARTWVASSVPSTLTTHGGDNQYVSHISVFSEWRKGRAGERCLLVKGRATVNSFGRRMVRGFPFCILYISVLFKSFIIPDCLEI